MVALLAGEPFDIDPLGVSWDFRIHVVDKPMIGGKVVQVFGADIGDITVDGSFTSRTADIDGQLAMLNRMKSLATVPSRGAMAPVRFYWPEQGWDFQVHLKEYSAGGGGPAVSHQMTNYAPKWRLVLFPVAGTDKLKEASVTTFIERLSAGIGWRQSKYNGPGTYNEVMSTLQGVGASTLDDFNNIAYGLGTAPSNVGTAPTASPGTGVGTAFATGRALTVDEMLKLASSIGWTGEHLRIAVAIAYGESRWNPNAKNLTPPDYSIGLWQINMLAHNDRFGTEDELCIPERNAQAAWALYTGRGRTFADWSVYKSGEYLQYMPDVGQAATRMGL